MGNRYSPSNDWCRAIGENRYADAVYSGRRRDWRAMVNNRTIGRWPTKRRAKKAALRHIARAAQ